MTKKVFFSLVTGEPGEQRGQQQTDAAASISEDRKTETKGGPKETDFYTLTV